MKRISADCRAVHRRGSGGRGASGRTAIESAKWTNGRAVQRKRAACRDPCPERDAAELPGRDRQPSGAQGTGARRDLPRYEVQPRAARSSQARSAPLCLSSRQVRGARSTRLRSASTQASIRRPTSAASSAGVTRSASSTSWSAPSATFDRCGEPSTCCPRSTPAGPDVHSADVRVFDRAGIWVSNLHVGLDLTPANLVHDLRVALHEAN